MLTPLNTSDWWESTPPPPPTRSAWSFTLKGRERGLLPHPCLSCELGWDQGCCCHTKNFTPGCRAGDRLLGWKQLIIFQVHMTVSLRWHKLSSQVTARSAEAPGGASTCPGSQVASGEDLVLCLLGSILSQLKLDPRGAET